jgi:hypothetical protein
MPSPDEISRVVRLELADALPEGTGDLLSGPVQRDRPDVGPGRVPLVRGGLATAGVRDLVAGRHESRYEIRPDVTGPAQDHAFMCCPYATFA